MNKIFNKLWGMFDCISEKVRFIRIPMRLIISYVAVSMVPVIVIGLFSGYIAQKSVLDKIYSSTVRMTESVNYDIKRYMDDLLDISNSIIYSKYIQEYLIKYINNPLNKHIPGDIIAYIKNNISLSSISDIRIVTENDKLIHYKTVYRLRSDEMEKLKSEINKSNGLPVFIPVRLESGNNGISLVRAIYSSKDLSKIGEIYITITEKSIRDIYDNIDFGKDAFICLINSSTDIVSGNIDSDSFDSSKITEKIKTAENGKIEKFNFNIGNNKYLVLYSNIESLGWYVVCFLPYSYLNSVTDEIKIYIYICVALCLFACTVLAIIINRSVSVPLMNLRNSIIDVVDTGSDNLSGKIEDYGKDEITDVAKSFNHMIDEINELIENVHVSEQQKSAEKFKALQAQINPHFLSNALNTVKWMASLRNADNIENLVSALIQLLQVSMGKTEDLVPLSREIEYIKSYVEIQSFKYWDKFTIEYNIAKNVEDCLIPPFSIQPIVENAIIHGIEPKAGKGIIWISADRVGKEVICEVKDNGIGFSDEHINLSENIGKKHISGIGMKNVDERIKMFFGEFYGITFESIPGIYTKVKIKIPYRTNGTNL